MFTRLSEHSFRRRAIEEADEAEFVAGDTHAGLTGSLEAPVNCWVRVTRMD